MTCPSLPGVLHRTLGLRFWFPEPAYYDERHPQQKTCDKGKEQEAPDKICVSPLSRIQRIRQLALLDVPAPKIVWRSIASPNKSPKLVGGSAPDDYHEFFAFGFLSLPTATTAIHRAKLATMAKNNARRTKYVCPPSVGYKE
jgi:hypothetical protein